MSFRSAVVDLFRDQSDFDFTGRRRTWFLVSGVALTVGFAALFVSGLNLGIEFEGGTAWQVEVGGRDPRVAEVRDVLDSLGERNAKVSILGGDEVRVQSISTDEARVEAVRDALAGYAGLEDPEQVSIQTVGPTFGAEVTEQALRALVIFLIAVLIYLAIRFEFKMAVAAMAALAHDVGLTVGVYALTGFEVTPATVIAILTILGYSLYDTVVVFDKIKDHVDAMGTGGSDTYSDTVNRSLNEVLMRSLNTSITTLIPVASLLVVGSYLLGALTIREFSLALFIGLLAGTYSSIFVAAQVLAWWKEREPRYAALRERVERRAPARAAAKPAPAAAPVPGPEPEPTPDEPEPEPAEEPEPSAEAPEDRSALDELADALEDDLVVKPKPRKQRRKKRRG